MKRKAVALALIAVCCVTGFVLWPESSSRQVLPDGTVLVLSGLKVGGTNSYSHGTRLSKALGRLAPSGKMLKLRGPGSLTTVQVHATVAIHENYGVEFMLQPRYESKPGSDRTGQTQVLP